MLLIKAVMNKLIVTLSLFFLKPVYIEIKIIFYVIQARRIILQESYISYDGVLKMSGLASLSNRLQELCLDLRLKTIKHEQNKRFPPT